MPWIGMYIAAASAMCAFAMVADGLSGFRSKKLWIPSMGNLMPSLGSMENNEIVVNLVALGILVATIAGNVFIYDFQMRSMYNLTFTLAREVACVALMVLMFLDLCCLGFMVANAKRYVESKYNEVHKRVPVQIRHYRCRKLLHGAKRLVVNICIGFQFLCVVTSKLLLLSSALCRGALLLLRKKPDSSSELGGFDLRPYVVLLEGETQLPKKILANICNEVENMIKIGERKQPKNLIKLLHKSTSNFNGVGEFDSDEVPCLHSQEPPNCWSLPVVTLTGIAVALASVTNGKAQQLLSGVREGLSLVSLIEKTHDEYGETESARDAADVVWVEVELYRKWQENDLRNIGRTHKETLQNLSSLAEKHWPISFSF